MLLEIAMRCEKLLNSVGIVNSGASSSGRSKNVTVSIVAVRLIGSVMRLFQFDKVITTELNVNISMVFKFDKPKVYIFFRILTLRVTGNCVGPVVMRQQKQAKVNQSIDNCNNLVDPASSHMLISKTKPCMSKYKLLYNETANSSLKQL